MNVELPDGTTIEGIPEGTTKAQIAEKLQHSGRTVPKEWFAPKAAAPAAPAETTIGQDVTNAGKEFIDKAGTVGVMPAAAMASSELGGKLLERGGKAAGEAIMGIQKPPGWTGPEVPPEARAAAATIANVGVTQGFPAIAGGGVGATAGRMAGKALQAPMVNEAKTIMQSAIKPILADLRDGDAAKAIDTMLEKGINVSKGGMEKLRTQIDALNQEIKAKIANSTATVSKAKVAGYLNDLLTQVKKQVNPQADVEAVKTAFANFWNHPNLGRQIPVQEAQELKQGTYKALSDKAYTLGPKSAPVQAEKTLARGLKEEVATAVPGVAGLNAEESKMLKALNVAERRVLIDANKNPMGLSLLAGNPQKIAAFMADRSPLFKSLAARMLNRTAQAAPGLGGASGAAGGAAAGAATPYTLGQLDQR